ncbi:hypothetical protein PQX77_021783 [Marasmius sp. AFHP31]|nr:hypothetical protein PQX77_021783 [Marasmius sp. AFHP31]
MSPWDEDIKNQHLTCPQLNGPNFDTQMAFRRKPAPQETTNCPICGRVVTTGGSYTQHLASCQRKRQLAEENMNFQARQTVDHGQAKETGIQGAQPPHGIYPERSTGYSAAYEDFNQLDDDFDMVAETSESDPYHSGPKLDDIAIDFHPACERPREHKAFEEYGVKLDEPLLPYNALPWRPFVT